VTGRRQREALRDEIGARGRAVRAADVNAGEELPACALAREPRYGKRRRIGMHRHSQRHAPAAHIGESVAGQLRERSCEYSFGPHDAAGRELPRRTADARLPISLAQRIGR